ncbi:MAG: toxin-antitoxin system HicB family antitoxin [Actinomycetota bacterium]
MAAERKSFPLRINPDLHAALEKWAADEMRSVNGQIEYLLSQAVRQAGRAPKPRRAPGRT